MRLGFVGSAHRTLGCHPDKSFRLASYSEERLILMVQKNLECIVKTLEFNLANNIRFYRIADFIPFASHPICSFDYVEYFRLIFHALGKFIQENEFRISMHPGQYVLLNSQNKEVLQKGIDELNYNTSVLDAMGLDKTAKVQIHVGGVYKNKKEAIDRFIRNFKDLPEAIKDRLVIENDDRSYNLDDCLSIHQKTGIPVVFDVFHHSLFSKGESIQNAVELVYRTWKKADGVLMVDYSTQEPEMKIGRPASTIDLVAFREFMGETIGFDFDVMLEVKDKEKSAIKAISLLKELGRVR